MFSVYLFSLLFKKPALVVKYMRAKHALDALERKGGILFVFPCYHVGGAEKVHYRIAQVAHNMGQKCSFLFLERSSSNAYRDKFKEIGHFVDLGFRYDNKKINDRIKELLIKRINASGFKFIFTSNSRYFYNLISELKPAKIIDVVHAYNPPFEVKNLDFVDVFPKLYKRIFINEQAFLSMKEYYREKGIAGENRFTLIYNAPLSRTAEPAELPLKAAEGPIHIIFVFKKFKREATGNSFPAGHAHDFKLSRSVCFLYGW